MKIKKISMIILLVVFIAAIGIVVLKINDISEKKISEISQNSENLSNDSNNVAINEVQSEKLQKSEAKKTGKVRKSTENVEADLNNILEITDNFFIEQTNDMYYNLEEYLGKTIKIEGFVSYYEDSNKDICYCVIRNTSGCCGNDGLAGLDIRYDGEYPELDTWVEVIGVVKSDTVYGSDIPAIIVTSITPKEEGKTFVTN